jgi:regulatory protein YycI of two-component signal transduction system YycFG
METSLSTYEMQLVTDAALLLTKNKIINKVYSMFGDLSEEYKRSISENNINVINLVNAKISKGENYQGLPYVMLDYPRQFSKMQFLQ